MNFYLYMDFNWQVISEYACYLSLRADPIFDAASGSTHLRYKVTSCVEPGSTSTKATHIVL